jgi:Protein of unknown function, DUF600
VAKMSLIEDKIEILSDFSQIIYSESPENCEYYMLTVTHQIKYDTFSFYFEFSKLEIVTNIGLSSESVSRSYDLAKRLYDLSAKESGGEWTSFTLTLDKDGKAHTKFHYPEAKPK